MASLGNKHTYNSPSTEEQNEAYVYTIVWKYFVGKNFRGQ